MAYVSLASDYQEGCHPVVMARLAEEAAHQNAGYGTDEVCNRARELIRNACVSPEADIHFLVGGTQVNMVVISALLATWEGVVAATSGHVSIHEAGAIERCGHKVFELEGELGKLSAQQVRKFAASWRDDGNRDHMVQPGMVYLSQPTEYGSLYSLSELEDMRRVCDEFGMRLYVDGARLAYALACDANDAGLSDLARLCDAFYIGGTKCGALLGEAVVFPNPTTCPRFFTIMKQHGALLAKGVVLGAQFEALFENGLYSSIGRPAIEAANRMRELFLRAGYRLAFESPTNQVLVELSDEEAERLAQHVGYSFWERPCEGRVLVRLAASWATTDEQIDEIAKALTDMKRRSA